MLLVTDNKIPLIDELFSPFSDIHKIPGHEIVQKDLINADILLTRTVTPVSKSLLEKTNIQFVGTATSGTDHIDIDYLKQHNIHFTTAAGANASAVVEYIICTMAALKKTGHLRTKNPVIGIVGCGHVGSRLAALLQSLAFEVICYDPLLSERPQLTFTAFETLIRESDLVTVHTPLTKTGPYPTYHLFNAEILNKMKPNSVLINSARGDIVDEKALLMTQHIISCIDVWENEPKINMALLNKAVIATPHIAGYTSHAKRLATEMIFIAAARHFGWSIDALSDSEKPLPIPITVNNWENKALSYFDPLARTTSLKNAIELNPTLTISEIFNQQRHLPLREGFL